MRLLAVAAVVSVVPAFGSVAAAAPDARPAGAPSTVTLITGDEVTVSSANVFVTPARGREHMRFLISNAGGEHRVVPGDAMTLLRSGRLDPRLFNITTLLASGYDKRADGLPLIVTGSARSAPAVPNLTVTKHLPAANAVAANAGRGTAFWNAWRTARAPDTKIWLDGKRTLQLDQSVPLVGAPVAWQAGYDGAGVKVAVLDSGADVTHLDLAGKVAAMRNFTEAPDEDTVGHGTHVASTVAGTGAASDGRFRGVAPGARLLIGKVCPTRNCDDSAILEGIQWAAEQGAAVVNMSFGSPDTPGLDPVEEAIGAVTERFGTLFVASAGNFGTAHPVGSPSTADAALSVAATTKADTFADLSSAGPRPGDRAIKPEISAPGVAIGAARSKDMPPPSTAKYVSFTGTSMSSPHVAGAAAILAQLHPNWKAGQLKAALTGSAKPLPDVAIIRQGAGRLDVARAVGQPVVADQAALNYGIQRWPHDGPAVPKRVTYANHGTQSVTLNLSATGTGPDGKPVPAATLRPSPASVTVPAGGQARIDLLLDTKALGSVFGLVTGVLTATGGDTVITTPIGMENEVESYDLTINHRDRTGAAATGYGTSVFRMDQPSPAFLAGPELGDVVRVPRGDYTVLSTIGDDPDNLNNLVVHPRVRMDATRTVVSDARVAKPITVTPPRKDLRWHSAIVGVSFTDGTGYQFESAIAATTFDGVNIGRAGPDVAINGIHSFVRGVVAEPGPAGDATDSPAVYNMGWHVDKRVITGFTKHAKQRDFAAIQVSRATSAAGSFAQVASIPEVDGIAGSMGGSAVLMTTRLPFHRTEYVTSEGGVRWFNVFIEFGPQRIPINVMEAVARRFDAGRSYTDRYNFAVLGPALARGHRPYVFRIGDTLHVDTAFRGDSSGKYGLPASPFGTAMSTVFRNGELFGQRPFAQTFFVVPPEPAEYRLELSNTPNSGELSTFVQLNWTFRSEHVAGDKPGLMPLWAVRFVPSVDDSATAPAGRRVVVPVLVDSQPDGDVGRLRDLSVEVSTDDGQTWRTVPLIRTPSKFLVVLENPATDGFVSLRAKAADSKGNKMEQTIIRAYRVATTS